MHIYTPKMQPATSFVDECGAFQVHSGFDPDELIYCRCCNKKHPAKDCVVQCYYDGMSIWCAPGKGCKDLRVIAVKKAKEFSNRSAGQKRRWANYENK
jgi:hypothetical protein